MFQTFRAVGFSYQSSPISIREQVAFNDEQNRAFLVKLGEILGLTEILILSTCNRTEIYYSDDIDLSKQILSLIGIEKGIDASLLDKYYWTKIDQEAITHLYSVAMGLEAKIVGDIQIANQVKRAYQCTADEGKAGPLMHRLMHSIFYANKRVVQETAFRDGAASTSYASVELIQQFALSFQSAKVLVLGIGEIGRNVAENLAGLDAEVTIANRTLFHAEELAIKYGYSAITFNHAKLIASEFDVIISSVPVQLDFLFEKLKKSITQKLLIDLSVPRSIHSNVEKIPGMILYNIDQIEEKTSVILSKRKKAIPSVKKILAEEINSFNEWTEGMEVSPTIKRLKQVLDEIRKEELARYLKNASKKEKDLIDKVTKSIIQKVIKLPVLHLKAACKRGEGDTLIEVLNDLFDLEKENKNP